MACGRKGPPVRQVDDMTFNLWRAAAPPPGGAVAVASAKGHMVNLVIVQNGGNSIPGIITDYLTCNSSVDIRDGSNPANGQMLLTAGDWLECPPSSGRYWRVLLVQVIAPGLPGEYRRAYLSRWKQTGA